MVRLVAVRDMTIYDIGKSYLLVALIHMISKVLDEMEDTETRILVSSLTNVAVDRILVSLLDSGYTDFARVGSLKKINKLLLPFSHHSAIKKEESDKEALRELEEIQEGLYQCKASEERTRQLESVKESISNIRKKDRKMRQAILDSKRVVGVTIAASSFDILKDS
jgi:nicotinamide mononucleotide adenylyltransferase